MTFPSQLFEGLEASFSSPSFPPPLSLRELHNRIDDEQLLNSFTTWILAANSAEIMGCGKNKGPGQRGGAYDVPERRLEISVVRHKELRFPYSYDLGFFVFFGREAEGGAWL